MTGSTLVDSRLDRVAKYPFTVLASLGSWRLIRVVLFALIPESPPTAGPIESTADHFLGTPALSLPTFVIISLLSHRQLLFKISKCDRLSSHLCSRRSKFRYSDRSAGSSSQQIWRYLRRKSEREAGIAARAEAERMGNQCDACHHPSRRARSV